MGSVSKTPLTFRIWGLGDDHRAPWVHVRGSVCRINVWSESKARRCVCVYVCVWVYNHQDELQFTTLKDVTMEDQKHKKNNCSQIDYIIFAHDCIFLIRLLIAAVSHLSFSGPHQHPNTPDASSTLPQPRASFWGHYGLWHAPLAPWMLMPSGARAAHTRKHAHRILSNFCMDPCFNKYCNT